MMFIHSRLLPLFLILFLSACGGGSGGGGSSTDPDNDNGDGSSDTGGGNNNDGGTNLPPSSDIVVPTIPTSNQRIAACTYIFSGGHITREIFSYDRDGRIERIDYEDQSSVNPLPFNFGGVFINNVQFSYDLNGRIAAMEVNMADDLSNPDTITRRNLVTYTWDETSYMLTDVVFEAFDEAGALQSRLSADIDNATQTVNGWTETLLNITPVGSVELESTVTLAYGDNNLPQTLTRSSSTDTSHISYSWNDVGYILEIVDGSFGTTADEIILTYTAANKIESRTVQEQGGEIDNQTRYFYDADNLLERFTYANTRFVDHIDTTVNITWEDDVCQPTMIWATRAEPNFIATGNEPYAPATGYFQLNYCNL
jgi:hypothetical protein